MNLSDALLASSSNTTARRSVLMGLSKRYWYRIIAAVFIFLLAFITLGNPHRYLALPSVFSSRSPFVPHLKPQFPAKSNYAYSSSRAADIPKTNEAYVTFLGTESGGKDDYFREVRRLLFQLRHDPPTLDAAGRDFVVIITPDVPIYQVAQLEAEGALVEGRNDLEELPIPDNVQPRWRQVYTKLHIFNSTSYERILYLDADIFLARSLEAVWEDPNSRPLSGLAAMSDGSAKLGKNHPIPQQDHSYFNAGFMLLRPDQKAFDQMLHHTEHISGFQDQALLNDYFSRWGPRPWEPLNHIFCGNFATRKDLEYGVHALHEKLWIEKTSDPVLHELWKATIARMEGFWLRGGV